MIWRGCRLVEMFKKTADCFAEMLDDWTGLLLLVTLSLAIKGAIVFASGMVNVDGVVYINAAQEIAEGDLRGALAHYRMPFLPLLIAALHLVVPDWVLAGQLVSLLTLVGAVIPLYLTTKKIYDARTAFWAGLAFCLSPMINGYAADVYRDPVFLFFFAWSVYFAVCAINAKGPANFVLVSIFVIFAFLCRIEAISLPVAFLLIVVALAIRKVEERKDLLTGAAVFLVVPTILAGLLWLNAGSEWGSYNRFAEPLSRFYGAININKYHQIYSQLRELERTMPGWGEFTHNFAEITRHYLWLLYLVGSLEIVGKLLFPTALIPLLIGFRCLRPLGRDKAFVLLLFGLYFLGCYHFHIQRNFMEKRYLLPPTYLLFPWVGAGLEALSRKVKRFRWQRTSLVLFLVFFCAIPLGESIGQVEAKDQTVKVAGEWLAGQPDVQEATIISWGRRLPFYAGRGRNFYPARRDLKHMEKIAESRKIDLMLIEAPIKGKETVPEFEHYELLREFSGMKEVALIYRRKL